MTTEQFKSMLNEHPEMKKDLFIRGFLVTSKKIENLEDFPFCGNWTQEEHGGFFFLKHELANAHFYDNEGRVFFILGHAYNPFTMEIDELKILQHIAEAYGTDDFIERINDITGVFVLGDVVDGRIEYLVDPSGMQSACSGYVDGVFYLTSHAQLVGDICDLSMDPFVNELVHYKWYNRILGPYLPADLTPFKEMKRVVPSNMFLAEDCQISHKRFWPLAEQTTAVGEEYDNVIKSAADILKNNMELVSRKWQHPWISLTGGIDSNTTFAAANGIYDRFETFSYLSAQKEVPDVEAARKISSRFNVKHHEYNIPENNDAIVLFEEKRELFRHNNGYIAELYDNEARKKFFLRDNTQCDVEVKSWVSETIRCYWYKYYGRKSFPKLSAKLYRNLYKIFITNRNLAHRIDILFARYIDEYEYRIIPSNYPTADIHYNEVSWGSWGGLNISEMKYCFDITFIYNNRRFLNLMFRVPIDKRISDQHHLDMKRYLSPELADMNIRVKNMKETKNRARALNLIFKINTFLPF